MLKEPGPRAAGTPERAAGTPERAPLVAVTEK